MESIAQIVLTWLREAAAESADVEIGANTELIEQGVLDSLAILKLVCFVEDRFGVTVPVEEFAPDNFGTAAAIAAMVARLCGAPATSAASSH